MATAKDLYKSLTRNDTTEQLFGVSAQPENTCPMIDATVEDVKTHLSEIVSLKYELREYENTSSSCHSKEAIEFNSEISNFLETLDNWTIKYNVLLKRLETLRSYVETIRANAKDYKSAIWHAIDISLDINEKEQTFSRATSSWRKPGSYQRKQDMSRVQDTVDEIQEFEKLSFSRRYPECEECLLHGLQNEVVELINKISPSIFVSSELSEIRHKEKLEAWVEEVFNLNVKFVGESFISLLEIHGYTEIE